MRKKIIIAITILTLLITYVPTINAINDDSQTDLTGDTYIVRTFLIGRIDNLEDTNESISFTIINARSIMRAKSKMTDNDGNVSTFKYVVFSHHKNQPFFMTKDDDSKFIGILRPRFVCGYFKYSYI